MSAAERMSRLRAGLSIDRVPVVTNATIFSGVFARMTSREFFCSAENMYSAQRDTRALFGCHGGPTFCLTNWQPASLGACGTENIYLDTPIGPSVPQIQPVIRSAEDVENFSIPSDLSGIEALEMRREFIRLCAGGGSPRAAMNCGSVVELASQIVEIPLLFKWMLRSPELAFRIFDMLTEHILRLVDSDIAEYGVGNCTAMFFYPLESRDIMSPRLLEKFSWPYISAMHDALRERGVRSFSEHLCGCQDFNIDFFRSLALPARTVFSLDERTDIAGTARALGADYIMSGNVSSALLMSGTPQDVVNECAEILAVGKKLDGGFILSPSCDLPPHTPPLNLYAMHRASCEYGRF